MTDLTIERFLPGLDVASRATRGGVAWLEHSEGPLMLLFHGGAGSWNHWAANIAALGASFRVCAIDSPGFGASADVARDLSWEAYHGLITAAVDEICEGEDDIHVAGFSFGGLVASSVAAHLSERMAGLTLIGSAGFRKPLRRSVSLKSIRALTAELGRTPTAEEIRALHAANLGQLMIWSPAKIDAQAIDLQAANVDRTRFDSRPYSWSGLTPLFVQRADCPLQVIFGCYDSAAGSDIEHRIEACLEVQPDAEVEVLPDCGHWAMYEAAELVNELMLDFHEDLAGDI